MGFGKIAQVEEERKNQLVVGIDETISMLFEEP